MELEVRVVAGIDNCFVSLPLNLIDTLQSTRSGLLPQVLSLELRSRSNNDLWVVAWSGATSSSSSIEVAKQFAECISLADHTIVQVRVVSDIPKATLVTIEPLTEDDWEVLELNSEHAEAAILNQVRIVHEAMRFPLWLHGRTIIKFHVVSTFPNKPVVQLVPGTEVAVAPKRRKKSVKKLADSYMQSSKNRITKAVLRLQDSDQRLFHSCCVKGVELGVALTSVAFINPETAKCVSLDSLQLVAIVPRLSSKESIKNPENSAPRIKNNSTSKDVKGGILTEKKGDRQAIVRLLVSDSVAKGHIMIARSLRLYLNAGLHSCMLVLPII
ncbi:hypothetical protein Patl1_11768 [Pistacia atlantica]|uniref:Uncharacterized protein n=1 Tax=Pistacia atlantica TaxID=434234 RepID=A0ACC1AA47_9ROSI|nr:hypothetical protein Patl1_11768 [Pistacia atlantica]